MHEKTTALSAVFNHGKGCTCGCRAAALSVGNVQDLSDINLSPQQLNQQMQPLVVDLVQAFRQGKNYEDAMTAALLAYPTLSDEQLVQGLAQALFVADIWGRINGAKQNGSE